MRSTQLRGLFTDSVVPQNSVVAAVPLSSSFTTTRAPCQAVVPSSVSHITVENVNEVVTKAAKEIAMLSPQVLLAIQLAAMAYELPNITNCHSPAELAEYDAIRSEGIAPWVRMIDDEDFNEQFMYNMYGSALDRWQRQHYDKMTALLGTALAAVHDELHVPFLLPHFRRYVRLVISRVEHIPSYLLQSQRPAWYQRFMNKILRKKEPSEVSLMPLVDMVNHSNRPNCVVELCKKEKEMRIRTVSNVGRGEELCRHYNFALTRDAALFRYGFLPFDLIAIIEPSAVDEHLYSKQHMLMPEDPEKVKQREDVDRQVSNLERLFKEARTSSNSTSPS